MVRVTIASPSIALIIELGWAEHVWDQGEQSFLQLIIYLFFSVCSFAFL